MEKPEIPFFTAYEVDGQYMIEFKEKIPGEIRAVVDLELSKIIHCHSTYHLETFVENIFRKLIDKQILRKSPITKTWTLAKSVRDWCRG